MQQSEGTLVLADDVKGEVPLSRETRIREISLLPNSKKGVMLPPAKALFQLGPFVYQVVMVNVGGMRFTAKLYDVKIEGVND